MSQFILIIIIITYESHTYNIKKIIKRYLQTKSRCPYQRRFQGATERTGQNKAGLFVQIEMLRTSWAFALPKERTMTRFEASTVCVSRSCWIQMAKKMEMECEFRLHWPLPNPSNHRHHHRLWKGRKSIKISYFKFYFYLRVHLITHLDVGIWTGDWYRRRDRGLLVMSCELEPRPLCRRSCTNICLAGKNRVRSLWRSEEGWLWDPSRLEFTLVVREIKSKLKVDEVIAVKILKLEKRSWKYAVQRINSISNILTVHGLSCELIDITESVILTRFKLKFCWEKCCLPEFFVCLQMCWKTVANFRMKRAHEILKWHFAVKIK
jgi:hypothetical protein